VAGLAFAAVVAVLLPRFVDVIGFLDFPSWQLGKTPYQIACSKTQWWMPCLMIATFLGMMVTVTHSQHHYRSSTQWPWETQFWSKLCGVSCGWSIVSIVVFTFGIQGLLSQSYDTLVWLFTPPRTLMPKLEEVPLKELGNETFWMNELAEIPEVRCRHGWWNLQITTFECIMVFLHAFSAALNWMIHLAVVITRYPLGPIQIRGMSEGETTEGETSEAAANAVEAGEPDGKGECTHGIGQTGYFKYVLFIVPGCFLLLTVGAVCVLFREDKTWFDTSLKYAVPVVLGLPVFMAVASMMSTDVQLLQSSG